MIFSTSSNKSAKKSLFIYTGVTIFAGIFSFVYELFSHQVYSNFMMYAFVIPLALGVVPNALALAIPRLNVGSTWQKTVQAFAVATLSVGSILQGVVEIYGTTNLLIRYFFIVGGVLLLTSAIVWIINADRAHLIGQSRS